MEGIMKWDGCGLSDAKTSRRNMQLRVRFRFDLNFLTQFPQQWADIKGHFILGPIWSWAHLDLKSALTLALLYKVGCIVGLAI